MVKIPEIGFKTLKVGSIINITPNRDYSKIIGETNQWMIVDVIKNSWEG